MNRKAFTLSTGQTEVITYSNADGQEMKIYLEPLPRVNNYHRGRATFVIEGGEILGSYYWPNLTVSLYEHLVTTHPNQLMQKAFSHVSKYNYATDIEAFKAHIESIYAESIQRLSTEQKDTFKSVFASWGEMPVHKDTLFHTDEMCELLNLVIGDDWISEDIIPKSKTSEYELAKKMITEFQKAYRGELNMMIVAP